jgi:hypothetical protein
MLRFDHVGVVVDDLDAVAAFFVSLGFEREGGTLVEGETVDRINGLDGVRADVVMVRTPDGSGKLELVKYHAPADTNGVRPLPPNHSLLNGSGTSASRSRTSTGSSTDSRRGLWTRVGGPDHANVIGLLRPRSGRTDRRTRRERSPEVPADEPH